MTEEKEKLKFEGEAVYMGGREYVVPSLSVAQAKELWPKLLDLNKGVTVDNLPEKHAESVDVIFAALSRNYPELRREEVADLVDMRNLRKLMSIVSGQSGLTPPGIRPAAEG